MHGLETAVFELANFTQMLFEAASILVVTLGGIAFGYAVVSQRFAGQATKPRQTLARFLIVALELQLAADIIATATNPSIDELIKLAAIAVIRTFLNYFLVLEMREENARHPVRVSDPER